jgi:polyhydroxyalkanoate synthase
MSSSQDSQREPAVAVDAARSGSAAPPAKAVRKTTKTPAVKAALKPAEAKPAAADTIKSEPSRARVSRPPKRVLINATPKPKPAALEAEAEPKALSVAVKAAPVAAPAPVAVPAPAVAPAPVVASAPAAAGSERTTPNFERMADNMARAMEQFGKALAASLKPVEAGKVNAHVSDDMTDAMKTFGQVAEYWLADPRRTIEAQSALSTQFLGLWANTLRRMSGEEEKPFLPVDPKDKRFTAPDWQAPAFDFIRQAYGIANNWFTRLVEDAELDKRTRDKAAFYVRQLAGALSPSNFLLTNPEILRATWSAEAENLARGMKMLAEDIEAGGGNLKIRQTTHGKYKVGVNLATTPGKVVMRNDLCELIQYTPTTEQVYKRPLLIVPPWINKFYILDLNAEKSFIKWAVSQGLTVFCMSWINPDARHADKGFEAYMREGVFESLDRIETITGEKQVTAIGYCVGGTLTAATLAYMAAKHDDRISSATLFTTQVDFSEPGDLKVFADEDRIKNIEAEMHAAGYLEGKSMANAFNMLRPNDMIWSYVVNNYLKGIEPMAFDLLTWNSDSTRMPRANHSYYLRNCYLENRFAKGEMKLGDEVLNLHKITIPIYNLAAKEDHIAPAKSVFNGAKLFGGEMRYVLGGSGHIAGVVNPPGPKPKYQYWTGPRPTGAFEAWVGTAEEHPGSWWPDWLAWIDAQAPEKVPAREPGGGVVPLLGDAPGEYVLIKA